MGIDIGGNPLAGAAIGDTPLKGITLGDTVLWTSAPPFEPTLVSVTMPGSYNVPWPAGATKCDVCLWGGGGGGGGGYGGNAGLSPIGSTPNDGGPTICYQVPGTLPTGSPGNAGDGVSAADWTYAGGVIQGGAGGSAAGFGATAGNGTAPGGGGGGYSGGGYPGGGAGALYTVTLTVATALTGTVGLGGEPLLFLYATLGYGGNGAAYFYFYT